MVDGRAVGKHLGHAVQDLCGDPLLLVLLRALRRIQVDRQISDQDVHDAIQVARVQQPDDEGRVSLGPPGHQRGETGEVAGAEPGQALDQGTPAVPIQPQRADVHHGFRHGGIRSRASRSPTVARPIPELFLDGWGRLAAPGRA